MKRKVCPLMVQHITSPSLTIKGESYTTSIVLECLGPRCAAYMEGEFCAQFQTTVELTEAEGEE